MTSPLTWKKFHPLTDQNAFICLVDSMGDDSSIVQAARVSYGKDKQADDIEIFKQAFPNEPVPENTFRNWEDGYLATNWLLPIDGKTYYEGSSSTDNIRKYDKLWKERNLETPVKDRNLIRYLLNHGHTTPFEMVEIKFMVQVPMDCWRQWIRHRTASVNEYSTRYTEALDFFQVTDPKEWRLQATSNKQGSSGYLEEGKGGANLSATEKAYHNTAKHLYQTRLDLGVAKEQARKDLPLSTYTRAYWKCDLHNIFNFLRLRMDSHAQLEIRQFANCMFEIVKSICPVACEAFEDYVLHAKKFSRMEMGVLRELLSVLPDGSIVNSDYHGREAKPSSMTDREWKEFQEKVAL